MSPISAADDQDQPGEEEEEAETPTDSGLAERVEVKARADDLTGVADSATQGATGAEDLERRPKLRVGEVVETVPGLIATQHSGGGKGHQYFLRGFNLDHGTDFRVSVADMQVNLPTHGHGQGYADLNFLIPEMIDSARYRKGMYSAGTGDFSAAGSVDIDYHRSVEKNLIAVEGGGDGYRRFVMAGSAGLGGGDLLGALEYYHYDGPWERPDDFEKINALLRYSGGGPDRGFSLTSMAYDGSWDATDQIPRRAVEQGLVGRFGLLDRDLRGESSRYSLSGEMHRRNGTTLTRFSGFALSYDLDLLSNFTYNLDDQSDDTRVDGDQFLQVDDRMVFGARLEQERWAFPGGRAIRYAYGGDLRYDDIDEVGLLGTLGGVPTDTIRRDRVGQLMAGLFVESEVRWNESVRSIAGVRADFLRADVDSDLAANSGTADDSLVSPKFSLILGPWNDSEVYLNWGLGFHSNDARGATIRVDPRTGLPVERVNPLVRARGADVGIRTTALHGLQSTVTLFWLEIDSELIFVGDAGGTEPSRPSRRVGVELTNFYRISRRLSFDLDVTLGDAAFTDADPVGDEIPGGIEQTVAAGLSFAGDDGPFGSLRWRYFGPRPLIEDDSVRSGSTSLVNTRLGYAFRNGLTLGVDVFNLLDREDSDIEYFYASRLPGEPAEGVEDVHFHPMESRTVRLWAKWRF